MVPAFDDRDGLIWKNGELVDWRDAKVHVLNHGLHYASAVFEGERAYNRVIFKLHEHTERLFASARSLSFEIPYTVEEIDAACDQVVRENGLVDAYVRPIAWRGSEMMAVSAQRSTIHVAIAAWPWPSMYDPEEKLKGIRLDWAEWRRPDPATIPAKTKATGLYMICTLSKHAAEAKGFHDALMLDWRGLVAEATGANVFFVRGGELHTPTPDCILDGITKRTVMDLAKDRQLKVIERAIDGSEIVDGAFEECFLTGTAAEVTPVASVGDVMFPERKVCRQLMEDYAALVRKEGAEKAVA
ncbi:MAG: branched-chain amino acid aminotransferase [Pseudomonadota bacterium]